MDEQTMSETDPCAVCGDTSTGFHYGVNSCEGCKSFFKRTIQRQNEKKYVCVFEENCIITKNTRSRCQACRLKKCFSVGMVTKGVRPSRERGGRSFYFLKEPSEVETCISTSSAPQVSHSPEILPSQKTALMDLSNSEIIQKLADAKPEYPPPDENLIPITEVCPMLTERDESGINITLAKFSRGITSELRMIVQWAKALPGFTELSTEDKSLLLTSAGMEIICFRCIYRSIPFEDCLMMNEETVLSRVPCYEFMSHELVDLMLHMVDRLRTLKMDSKEFACISAMVLINPDTEGLSNKAQISSLQGRLLMALKEYTESTYPHEQGRFAKLLLRMPGLREVCAKGFEFYFRIQNKLEGEVPISPLACEMFDSSRN